MAIKFTEHALKQMKSRGITLDEVKETLNNPENVVNDSYGNVVAQRLFGSNLLRIFYYLELFRK